MQIEKVYIVYEGEFTTDKPRDYMAEPTISLVTTDEDKAYGKLDELRKEYSERNLSIQHNEDSFGYNDGYKTHGKVGILTEILE